MTASYRPSTVKRGRRTKTRLRSMLGAVLGGFHDPDELDRIHIVEQAERASVYELAGGWMR